MQNISHLNKARQVDFFPLRNNSGMKVVLCNYGARVQSIVLRDKHGRETDVILGYDTIEGYLQSNDPYFGATVGRFANRISRGRFCLQGKELQLSINDGPGPNHVHGGIRGFSSVVWKTEMEGAHSILFHYHSKHMEEGYPGNMDVQVRYRVTDDNSLVIDYRASTDAPTICNLTNHCFFNLNGTGNRDISEHLLLINAKEYSPVDKELLPLGEHLPVNGSPFDFRRLTSIGSRLGEDHEQLKMGRGYCHNFVLAKDRGNEPAASAVSLQTGVKMDMYTTEPGIQFYSCGYMDGSDRGKNNTVYTKNSAFCLEAQHFPDSPNHPEFPETQLLPGEAYSQTTIYKFSLIKT